MAVSLMIYLYSLAAMSNTYQGCHDVEIVSRERWGARPSLDNATMEMPVHHIFIHHTAGLECSDLSSCSKVMRGIQNFHMDDRGWDDIGYNFLIGGDGRVYQGRGWTRVGAHTYGFNRISIAFSLMGNFQDKEPPSVMLDVAKKMIRCAQEEDYVTDFELHGHRDGGCTLCPGQKLYDIIKTWPNFVGGPLPGWRCWSKEVLEKQVKG